jgi:dTDP-4-amino-4,6-dideoxygalactose transaminase
MRPVFAEQIQDKQLINEALTFSAIQYRMNEFSGAVMLAQMKKLENILAVCQKNHAKIRDKLSDNAHFIIRWVDGDSGVSVFMLFPDAEKASRFQNCLSAEGIPVGAKSACRNMMDQYPIITKALHHDALPPFGKGYNGESTDYGQLKTGMKTDGILSRYVAVSIGPQYTEHDISDIIRAIEKVDKCLYEQKG